MPIGGPIDIEAICRTFCRPGDDVIDVGANIGITSVLEGLIVNPGRVIAIEPVPPTFEHLAKNVRTSGLPNITCLKRAASRAAGEVKLVSRPKFGFAAYVGDDGAVPGCDEFQVPSATLDEIVRETGVGNVRFVKIDVEGYELEVLAGADELLSSFEPVVLLEANHYCLNIFRKLSMVDFVSAVLSIFPFAFAIDFVPHLEFVDLRTRERLPDFYHANVVRHRFANFVCGFDRSVQEHLDRVRTQSLSVVSVESSQGGEKGEGGQDQSDHGADLPQPFRVSDRERAVIMLKRRLMNMVYSKLRR